MLIRTKQKENKMSRIKLGNVIGIIVLLSRELPINLY